MRLCRHFAAAEAAGGGGGQSWGCSCKPGDETATDAGDSDAEDRCSSSEAARSLRRLIWTRAWQDADHEHAPNFGDPRSTVVGSSMGNGKGGGIGAGDGGGLGVGYGREYWRWGRSGLGGGVSAPVLTEPG